MGKKTRLLMVITQGEMGGAQRYVFDLASHLDKNRYEILVALGSEKSALQERLEQNRISVKTVPHLVRNIHPLYDLLAVSELEKLIKKFRPDIVHLNSSKAGVIGSIAAGLAKNPNVIFTAHGFAFLEPHNFLVRQIYFRAEKFASRLRKKIITVSENDRQAAVKNKLCSPDKLITIHNGIDSSLLLSPGEGRAPRSVPARGREVEPFTIGTIAHDYPTKDLKTLRAAFQILKKEFPNLELTVIGRGGTTGELTDAAKLLSTFDIYVCSSIKEGFPYSVLEAMAAGLPIVSTNVGGIPEMLGSDCGLLVPPRNPQALAAAIKKLILDPELAKKLGTAARKKVREFSLDNMLAETERVYRL